MPVTNIFLALCSVAATPKGPRKPAGGTGETFLRAYRLNTVRGLRPTGV